VAWVAAPVTGDDDHREGITGRATLFSVRRATQGRCRALGSVVR